MGSRSWKTHGTTILVATLAWSVSPAAVAAPPDRSGVVDRSATTDEHALWIGDGVIVLHGPPIEEGCFGEGFDDFPEMVVETPSGVTTVRSAHTDHVWVFDDAGFDNPFAWLFEYACPAVSEGEGVPVPLAHGEGRVTFNGRFGADGSEQLSARMSTEVTTADGKTVHLNARGRLDGSSDHVNYGG